MKVNNPIKKISLLIILALILLTVGIYHFAKAQEISLQDENKAVLKCLVDEAYNQRNLDVIDEIADSCYVEHTNGVTTNSRDIIKQTITWLAEEAPDFTLVIEDLIAEGDKVVLRATLSGTHEGALQGIPPTQKKIQFSAMRIYRITDGKIVETHVIADTLGLLQQLGVIPTPG